MVRFKYFLASIALVWGAFHSSFAFAQRPNILLIITDDQRPDTIGALGNSVIRTPHLDALVRRGSSFLNAYAGYPVCHVSRGEIITGCTAFRNLAQYPTGAIDSSLATLAGTFQANGYRTWYTGKWHNDGLPIERGYMGTRGLYSSGGAGNEDRGPAIDERGNPRTGYGGWTFKSDDGKPELDKGIGLQSTNSLHVVDGAIRAIRETPTDQPFFLHVNFAFPHDPRQWPAEAKHRYDPDQMPLPKNFATEHPFDHGNFDGRDEQLLPRPRDPALVKIELAIYYAMISDVDAQIGRMMAALQEHHRENTLVVVISDQGLALGSHGLLGKQNQYQHSIRSPLILAGPRVPSGKRLEELVMLRDIFPTLCELSDQPIPSTVQGLSMVPLLQGKVERSHEFVVGVFTDTQRMICDGPWKLIVYPKVPRMQLFELKNDPDELIDLHTLNQHRPRLEELLGKLRAWCKSNGDRLEF